MTHVGGTTRTAKREFSLAEIGVGVIVLTRLFVYYPLSG
jgi:hypothetical protein